MAKLPQLLSFFRQTISFSFVGRTIIFAILFLLLSSILLNILNIGSVISSDYPLSSKLKILFILLSGSLNTISGFDILMLLVIAVLFGINLELVLQKISFVKKQHNLKITFGAGILSVASAGCASCGLSIISILGLGSAVAFLPLGGVELYIISILLLLGTLFYNLDALYKACKLQI